MEKLVIGIAGRNGSGKDLVADYLVSNYGAKKLVFSDMLKELLGIFIDENEISRLDMAWLSTGLRERYGEGVLAKGMEKRIIAASESIVVISGIRDIGELEMIRSFPKNTFIFINAEAEIRWKRMIDRQVKADDNVSFEEFLKRENLESESKMENLLLEADQVIDNGGEIEMTLRQVDQIMKKCLA